MSQTSKEPKKPILEFEHTLNVQVFEPEFTLDETVKMLDPSLLAKGEHKISIGTYAGGCCEIKVVASIADGYVQSIMAESCEDQEDEKDPELTAIMKKAFDALDAPEWQPMPVQEFVLMTQQGSYPPRAGTGAGCFYICLSKWCVFCCWPWKIRGWFPCWIERRKPDVIMGV